MPCVRRTSRLTLVAALAVAVGLAGLMAPAAARYLPTKRGSTDGDRPDRLDRLAHLIREVSVLRTATLLLGRGVH